MHHLFLSECCHSRKSQLGPVEKSGIPTVHSGNASVHFNPLGPKTSIIFQNLIVSGAGTDLWQWRALTRSTRIANLRKDLINYTTAKALQVQGKFAKFLAQIFLSP